MAEKNYLDFDLLIERSEKKFKARVISSPAGQASIEFDLPFSELELENFLLKVGRPRRGVRRIESPEMEAAKKFGGRLFETVFNHDIRGCLRSSLDEAERQGAGLRIRLRTTNAPELFDLPWEYLYNPALNRFLSLSILTPIIRYFDLPERIRPLAVQHPLRVLVLISCPHDYPKLDVKQEWYNLTTSLSHLEQEGLVEIEKLEQATLTLLQRQLRRSEYHIFQFIGHGGFDKKSEDGVLILEDEQGRGRLVSGQYLGTLLHNHRSLRLAILNACEGARTTRSDPFAGTAQSLVQQGIPAVIAMQFEITDQAAITFAQEFYSAVADGYPIDAALVEARTAIFAQGNDVEWGTPVLYLRSPDGHIFDIKQLSNEERRQARIAALYRKAQTALAREDWQNAISKLQEVLVQDPNNAEAKVSLSLAQQEQELADLYAQASEYYKEKHWAEALDCFQRIQDISPHYKQVDNLIALIQRKQEEQKRQENIVILLHEAQQAIAKEKWSEAEEKYQEALELEPTNAKAITGLSKVRKEKELAVLYAQAQEHYEAERWPEALECFNRVREINAQYKQVENLIAAIKQQVLEQKQQEKVIMLLSDAKEAVTEQDWQTAVEKYQAILEINPDHVHAKTGLENAQQELQLADLFDRGCKYHKDSKWSEALECFRGVEKIRANYKNVREFIASVEQAKEAERQKNEVRSLLLDAEKNAGKEDWRGAIEKYKSVLKLEPTNAEAKSGLSHAQQEQELSELYVQGQAMQKDGRWLEALKYFQQVQKIRPHYKQVEKLVTAIELAQEEQTKRDKVTLLFQSAEKAFAKENWQTAIEKYQVILELEPNHKKAKAGLKNAQQEQNLEELYNQGYEHYEAGEWLDALAYLRQVHKTRDDYKNVNDLIAKCEVKQKELQQISNLLSVGKNFYEKEKYQDALKAFQDIISIEHDHAESKHFIEMIQIKIKQTELVQKLFSEANSYIDNQKFSKAIETYKKILEIEPANKQATTGLKKAEKGLEQKAKKPAVARPIRTEKARFKMLWYAVATFFVIVGSVAGWYYFQKFKGEEKVDLSEPASIAQQQMLDAKSEAENAGAKTFLTQSYDLALNAEQKGNQAFAAGQYETANLAFMEATALFRKARDEAKALVVEEVPEPIESVETYGTLRVTSVPLKANVWIDNAYEGVTPIENKKLKTGQHELIIQQMGFEEFKKSFTVQNNKEIPIIANLKAKTGKIDIKSDPSNVLILLDNQAMGKTPRTLEEVIIGRHHIVLKKEGYRDSSVTMEVEQGKTHSINIELTAQFGRIKVRVIPWGDIYIDNVPKIKGAFAQFTEQLQVGTHTVKVEHSTLGTWEENVEITPDESCDIHIDFNKEVTVKVLCSPVWAEIFVDDKPTGYYTPKDIKVRVGKHAIEVRREGFTLEGSAKVRNFDKDAKVEFTLRKIQ